MLIEFLICVAGLIAVGWFGYYLTKDEQMAEIPRIVIKSNRRSGQPNPYIEHIKNTYKRNPYDPKEFVTKEEDAAFEVSSINENDLSILTIADESEGNIIASILNSGS